MLTNIQLEELCEKMDVPLETIVFKDQLADIPPIKNNRAYIVNMENEIGEDGVPNQGSHWVCFQRNQYPSGKTASIYFDSYGSRPSQAVQEFMGEDPPRNTVNIQSLMNDACGWYCCAFLHYINAYKGRTGNLYIDTDQFVNMFHDLDKQHDYKYNEYVLKHFFQSADPSLRKPITVKENGLDIRSIVS